MNKYTEQDYINKCHEFEVTYKGYHSEAKRGTMIDFECPKHIEKGIQSIDWSHFKNKKRACPYCFGKRNTEDAQKLVKNKNIVFLSEYLGSEKPIKCMCKECGNIWVNNRPIDLFKRDVGCPECARKIKGDKRRKSQNQFEDEMKIIYPNIKVVGKYINTHTLIQCECEKCKTIWESYPSNLLNQSAGCPTCNSSVGERKLIEFLEKYNINYKTQKTFDECKDIKKLKFDAYDIDNNIALEFQGEQHYSPIDFDTNNESKAILDFKALQHRDNIKIEYCKNNNIKLVHIPYWERNNVENFLLQNVEIYKEKYAT